MPKTTRAILAGVVIAGALAAPARGAGMPARNGPAPEPAGTGSYFFCAMGQTVKYFGLFTGNVPLAVAGAVGGGIACGMGW